MLVKKAVKGNRQWRVREAVREFGPPRKISRHVKLQVSRFNERPTCIRNSRSKRYRLALTEDNGGEGGEREEKVHVPRPETSSTLPCIAPSDSNEQSSFRNNPILYIYRYWKEKNHSIRDERESIFQISISKRSRGKFKSHRKWKYIPNKSTYHLRYVIIHEQRNPFPLVLHKRCIRRMYPKISNQFRSARNTSHSLITLSVSFLNLYNNACISYLRREHLCKVISSSSTNSTIRNKIFRIINSPASFHLSLG